MPWSPRGKYLWNFWFVRRGSQLHAFYLQADRAACAGDPERRHDLASIGHAVEIGHGTWEEVGPEPALAPCETPAWDDLALGAGSILAHSPDGPYTLFYTGRSRSDEPVLTRGRRQRPQAIGSAVSHDLRHWQRSPSSLHQPSIPNPGPVQGFDGAAWRDPCLLRGEDDLTLAFISARLHPDAGGPDDACAAIAAVSSADLEHWGPPRVFVRSDDFRKLEVPQVFWRRVAGGKRCYLLFSARQADCSKRRLERMPASECRSGTFLMTSDLLPVGYAGLPPMRGPARLLAPGLYAGKVVEPEAGGSVNFFGLASADAQDRFLGLEGPVPVAFDAKGGLRLDAKLEAWPA